MRDHNKYLTGNIENDKTEGKSSGFSYLRKESRESILQPQWSGIKQHASTSRIYKPSRLERERIEAVSSNNSGGLHCHYQAQNRRSIHKSMSYREPEVYSTNKEEQNQPINLTSLREVVPEVRYRFEYRSSLKNNKIIEE